MGQGYSRADYHQRTRSISASQKSSPNISESESESDGGRNTKRSVITNARSIPTSSPRSRNTVPESSPKRTQTPPSPHQIWIPPKETIARELQERQESQSSNDDDSLVWLAGLTATPNRRSPKESSRALGKGVSVGKQLSDERGHTRPSRRSERPPARSPSSPAKDLSSTEVAGSQKDSTWAEMDARELEFRKRKLTLEDQQHLIEEQRRLEEEERRFEEMEEERKRMMRKLRQEEGLWKARERQARQLREEAQSRVEEAITQEARTEGGTMMHGRIRELVLVEDVEKDVAPPAYKMNLVEGQIKPGDRDETQEQMKLELEGIPKDEEPHRQQHSGSRVPEEAELRARKARREKPLKRMSRNRNGAYRRARQRRQEEKEVKKAGKSWKSNKDHGHELGWDGEEWHESQSDTDDKILSDEESPSFGPSTPSRPKSELVVSNAYVHGSFSSGPPILSDIDAQLEYKSDSPSGAVATNCGVRQGAGKGPENGHDTKRVSELQEKQLGGAAGNYEEGERKEGLADEMLGEKFGVDHGMGPDTNNRHLPIQQISQLVREANPVAREAITPIVLDHDYGENNQHTRSDDSEGVSPLAQTQVLLGGALSSSGAMSHGDGKVESLFLGKEPEPDSQSGKTLSGVEASYRDDASTLASKLPSSTHKRPFSADAKDRQFPLELPREEIRDDDGLEEDHELFEHEQKSRNVTTKDSIKNGISLASMLPTPPIDEHGDSPCELGQKSELRRIYHSGSTEIYVERTNEDVREEVSNPLKAVAPEILSELAHLDLSHTVTFKDGRIVGGGTYGDVSMGSCDVTGRGQVKIAIKRLRFWLQSDIKTLFEREIYVWSKLRHPNILPLLGYAIDDATGYPLLISEWMENGTAWEYVISHPSCSIMNLVIGIAGGLAYLHSLGVVHSDIKSDNIMVSETGNALICDFGCSRLADSSRTYARLTSSVKGTSRYLAYELVVPLDTEKGFSGSHTLKTDVWAFGMTIFELTTHQRPYANLFDTQVVFAISTRVLPEFPAAVPSSIRHSALDRMKAICNGCWKLDPAQRPPMQSVLAELTQIRDMSVTPVST